MCGIFGFQIKYHNRLIAKDLTSKLLKISQERGREASGISLKTKSVNQVFKKPISGTLLSKNRDFNKIFEKLNKKNKNINDEYLSIIGQCRLTTNGKAYIDDFNQPVHDNNISLVHNGIILNTNELKNKLTKNNKEIIDDDSQFSDTYFFCKLINHLSLENNNHYNNFIRINNYLRGSYSIAFHDNTSENIYLTTNNGSLYYYNQKDCFIFASEKKFLEERSLTKFFKINKKLIKKIKPGQLITVKELDVLLNNNGFNNNQKNHNTTPSKHLLNTQNIIRCKKCLLPKTYPFIKFDNDGVCNYCVNYKPFIKKNKFELEKILDQKRSKDGSADCLIGLSGGRDSCYGLHILKEEYGMNPVAYTYDWGLTTNISRRNQALIVGKLGIEHIIRSPKIDNKRENIRKNIYAWLEKPRLGMVPLFMAGDKDFYQYGRTLRKDLNLNLTVFCSGQHYEQRNFFIGFCGIKDDLANVTARTYGYPLRVKIYLATYYILQYIYNPRYINSSFFDSLKSFFTTFVLKDDFLYLYEYLDWNETIIKKTLKDNYQWEEYKNYGENQWRMGDGQTAFTNYIFNRIAGFTEFDDFRSKQIRDGLITREEALELVKKDNQPKYEVLDYFAKTIGINLEHVLSRINNIETLY